MATRITVTQRLNTLEEANLLNIIIDNLHTTTNQLQMSTKSRLYCKLWKTHYWLTDYYNKKHCKMFRRYDVRNEHREAAKNGKKMELIDVKMIIDKLYTNFGHITVDEKLDYILASTIHKLLSKNKLSSYYLLNEEDVTDYLNAYEQNYKKYHSIDIWSKISTN